MAAAVALAQGDGDLWNSSLTISVKQLSTVQNHGIVLLTGTGEEAGNIDEADDWNVKRIAEAHEAGTLAAGVDVEHTGVSCRLVGDDADALTIEAGKTGDDVLGELRLHLEELTIVGDCRNHLIHVVGLVGVVGQNLVEQVGLAVDGIGALYAGSLLSVVGRNVAQELLDHLHALLLGLGREAGHTALAGVNAGATEVLGVDVLAGDGLHHLRTGEEHVAGALGHEDEVGEGRGVNGTTGAGAHDGGNLGNHTRSEDVALEDLTVTGQSRDAFLNAGATGVVHADDRRTIAHGHIHNLADLLSHGLR